METAHDKQSHDPGKPVQVEKITVNVIYNGVSKAFEVQPHAALQSLLAQAIAAFGTHALVLGWPDGTDLPTTGSIAEAGLVNGSKVVLRPHVVRGGQS